jgi:P-loop Domain of unknown function (DUF2791)
MMLTMRPEEWLGFVRREYLDSFIREGGASIKFCVPLCEAERNALCRGVRDAATALDYRFAEVDAARTKVQLPDQIFFRIAAQIDWQSLGRRVLVDLCRRENFEPPERPDLPFHQAVAERNAIAADSVLILLRQSLTSYVLHRSELARDFRIAMFNVCHALLTGAPDGAQAVRALTDWLTGQNRNVSAVKDYNIFNRITRNNARHFIESLFRWVRVAGYPGTVVLIDITRLAMPKNPRDDLHFYSTAALLDAYEVLREFVDATDRLAGCMLVVVADPSFLEEDVWGRGMGRYQALKFRIYDEVHDQRRVNPMGSLVRLSMSQEG